MTKVDVAREIRAAEAHLRRRCQIGAERVVRELAAIAFSDVGDVLGFTADGVPRLKSGKDIPAVARTALKRLRVRTRRGPGDGSGEDVVEVEVEMLSKLAALDRLGRHLGLFRAGSPVEAVLKQLPADLRGRVADAIGIPVA